MMWTDSSSERPGLYTRYFNDVARRLLTSNAVTNLYTPLATHPSAVLYDLIPTPTAESATVAKTPPVVSRRPS